MNNKINKFVKDFDNWNKVKKRVDQVDINYKFNYHKKDIWWCTVGINIGTEINGKNNNFERPVVVMKRINKHQFFGVPLSSNHKKDIYYKEIEYISINRLVKKIGTVCLNQLRVFSSKRLIRKIGVLQEEDFLILNEIISELFIKTKSRH